MHTLFYNKNVSHFKKSLRYLGTINTTLYAHFLVVQFLDLHYLGITNKQRKWENISHYSTLCFSCFSNTGIFFFLICQGSFYLMAFLLVILFVEAYLFHWILSSGFCSNFSSLVKNYLITLSNVAFPAYFIFVTLINIWLYFYLFAYCLSFPLECEIHKVKALPLVYCSICIA